jgi:hypothetical protein
MSSTSKRIQARLSSRKALREVGYDATSTAKVDIADEFYDSMFDGNKDSEDETSSIADPSNVDQDLLDILKFIQPKGWAPADTNDSKPQNLQFEDKHSKYFTKVHICTMIVVYLSLQ